MTTGERNSADWAGKTVWITGASSGIGEALALELARRGASPILSGRRDQELERVAALIATEGPKNPPAERASGDSWPTPDNGGVRGDRHVAKPGSRREALRSSAGHASRFAAILSPMAPCSAATSGVPCGGFEHLSPAASAMICAAHARSMK